MAPTSAAAAKREFFSLIITQQSSSRLPTFPRLRIIRVLLACLALIVFQFHLWNSSSSSSSVYVYDATTVIHPGNNGLQYGLTIVHCHEEGMEWLTDIPPHWNVTIYENCGETLSPTASRPFHNEGSEECSAYLTTMIERYDDLPDVLVFVQSDVLLSHGRSASRGTLGGKLLLGEHSPFYNFTELVRVVEGVDWGDDAEEDGIGTADNDNATKKKMGYLGFGPIMPMKHNINNPQGRLTKLFPREVFDIMALPYSQTGGTSTQTRSGACFAVHKSRILAHEVKRYRVLRERMLAQRQGGVKGMCFALEGTWHAVLGEDYILGRGSTLDDMWEPIVEFVGGWRGNLKQAMEEKERRENGTDGTV